jgi:hypothetical protein
MLHTYPCREESRVDQERQEGQQRSPRWHLIRRQLPWAGGIATLAFLLIVICGYFFGWKWTGLVADANYPNRTLWDWLDLLIVPVVLAIGGYLFNSSQNRASQRAADQRGQDEALQAYLDHMSDLLLEKHLRTPQEDSGKARIMARARTVTLLSRLDPGRKTRVVLFLQEAGLIQGGHQGIPGPEGQEPVIWLFEANLAKTSLNRTNLMGADLHEADLSEADLSQAGLEGANPWGGHLGGTDLSDAGLQGANLAGADLSGAMGITNEELERQASTLEDATLPNGQKYEDWLKDKEG